MIFLLTASLAWGQSITLPKVYITDKAADTTFLYKASVRTDTVIVYKHMECGKWKVDSATGRDSGAVARRDSIGIGVHQNNLIQVFDLINFDNAKYSTSIGYQAGKVNTGDSNTFCGYGAGILNTTGHNNTSIGKNALSANLTGCYNTAVGCGALKKNIANRNVAVGYLAMRDNTDGEQNVAVGAGDIGALGYNTTGNCNTAVGYECLRSNISAEFNTGLGHYALYSNTVGRNNVAVGTGALSQADTSYNTALGSGSFYMTLGGKNTGMGYQAGYGAFNGTDSNNTVLGYQAGLLLSSGSGNVLVGFKAGDNITTASNDIIIGNDQNAPSATVGNHCVIGNSSITDSKLFGAMILDTLATAPLNPVNGQYWYKYSVTPKTKDTIFIYMNGWRCWIAEP